MNKHLSNEGALLFSDLRQMIEDARKAVSQTVNLGMTLLYWNIGKRINEDVLEYKRAEYGKQILPTLPAKLVEEYGNDFELKKLWRMVQFASQFPDFEIVVTLSRQLS
jgi:hypothetical protein